MFVGSDFQQAYQKYYQHLNIQKYDIVQRKAKIRLYESQKFVGELYIASKLTVTDGQGVFWGVHDVLMAIRKLEQSEIQVKCCYYETFLYLNIGDVYVCYFCNNNQQDVAKFYDGIEQIILYRSFEYGNVMCFGLASQDYLSYFSELQKINLEIHPS